MMPKQPWKNGNDLREWLHDNRITQAQLARALGCRQSEISNWIVGRYRMPAGLDARLCLAYGNSRVGIGAHTHPRWWDKERHGYRRNAAFEQAMQIAALENDPQQRSAIRKKLQAGAGTGLNERPGID